MAPGRRTFKWAVVPLLICFAMPLLAGCSTPAQQGAQDAKQVEARKQSKLNTDK